MCTEPGASSQRPDQHGRTPRRRGRLAEARELCDRAIAIRQVVIKEYPKIVSYRSRMGECWLRSGQVRLAAGDIAGATADRRRALRAYADLKHRGAGDGDVRGRLPRDAFVSRRHERLRRATVRQASEAEKAMAILARSSPVATAPRAEE